MIYFIQFYSHFKHDDVVYEEREIKELTSIDEVFSWIEYCTSKDIKFLIYEANVKLDLS